MESAVIILNWACSPISEAEHGGAQADGQRDLRLARSSPQRLQGKKRFARSALVGHQDHFPTSGSVTSLSWSYCLTRVNVADDLRSVLEVLEAMPSAGRMAAAGVAYGSHRIQPGVQQAFEGLDAHGPRAAWCSALLSRRISATIDFSACSILYAVWPGPSRSGDRGQCMKPSPRSSTLGSPDCSPALAAVQEPPQLSAAKIVQLKS